MTQTPRILKLENMTHRALNALNPKKTIVIAAISPIEVHGPHLPTGQDLFEANALLERTAQKAVEKWPDWTILATPPLPIGCDTLPHLGSINYPAPLVRDIAYYTLRPFAKRGFARLAYSSFHGGPRHFLALEDAADKLSRRYNVAAISFFSVVAARMMESNFFHDAVKDSSATDITLAEIEKDLHAGFTETSIGLHLWPELVEDGWDSLEALVSGDGAEDPHKELLVGSSSKTDLVTTLRKVASGVSAVAAAIKHYKKYTYAGYPGKASAESGRLLFEHLVGIVSGIVDEFMVKGRKMDVHSPIWGLREGFLSPPVNTVLDEWLHLF